MAKLSKRAKAFRERVDANKSYPLDEAIAILKETATAKFNESVEVAVNLGVDARKSDQGVRGATTLPHGTGSEVRVAVFTQGENADKAKEAGADLVGFEELVEICTDMRNEKPRVANVTVLKHSCVLVWQR